MELDLEDLLRHHFPNDTIKPVPRGFHGGDVMQIVQDAAGQVCGEILWESKRTKSWNEAWLPKLRDDQRASKAHVAALLTTELPRTLKTFGCLDGIWVTNRSCVVGLAGALRLGLIEAERARRTVAGKQTKVELIYQYLTGREFQQRVEGIVEAFTAMRHDLDSEKRSFSRMWAKREKQIDRAACNTASLYGELGCILGTSLPQVAELELPSDEAILNGVEDLELLESPF